MIKLGLNQADIGGGRPKLPEGKFKVAIEKVAVKDSLRQKTKGDTIVIVNFKVLEVYSKKSCKDSKGNTLDIDVGQGASWSPNMKQAGSAGAVKAFTLSCGGRDPEDDKANVGVDCDSDFASLCGSDNPGRGVELYVETHQVVTEGGFPFMIHRWSPVTAA